MNKNSDIYSIFKLYKLGFICFSKYHSESIVTYVDIGLEAWLLCSVSSDELQELLESYVLDSEIT